MAENPPVTLDLNALDLNALDPLLREWVAAIAALDALDQGTHGDRWLEAINRRDVAEIALFRFLAPETGGQHG